MPLVVDTHCHLASEEFDKDREQVIERAIQSGVEKILIVGTELESSKKSLELAARFPAFRATVGVHPHDAAEYLDPEKWGVLAKLAADPAFCAIGETGLDYYYNHSPKEAQVEILERHIDIAVQSKRPLVLHCRDAYDDLSNSIRRAGKGSAIGVIHCFTGSTEQAKQFLDLGFYISFSGIVTFQNANALREACKTIPSDRLLVETDAPFLAPVPHRGKRNEPAFVCQTLEKVAAVRNEAPEKTAERTTENALRLFPLN